MKKIPTLFVRDPDKLCYVTDQVTPGCEWVLAGEGTATRKYDGTCVMFDGADWWARREVKPDKTPPPGWVEVDHDIVTGKRVGWEPIAQSSFAKFWDEARHADAAVGRKYYEGTYELLGPKVHGNPEGYVRHRLARHASAETLDLTMPSPVFAFDRLGGILRRLQDDQGIEGIVWHHPDGRMAKLKGRDFPNVDGKN